MEKVKPLYREEVAVEVLEEDIDVKDLVVFNDDFNTFEHVINTLIRVCKHSPEQAEQCTFLVHYKGKCDVKKGQFNLLVPFKKELARRGLRVSIN